MMKKYSIQEIAKMLAVNAQTLRRWDTSGRFKAHREKTGQINRYYYHEGDIEDFLSTDFRALFKMAHKWTFSKKPFEIPRRFYCPDKSIFEARLSRFEYELSQDKSLSKIFPLIVAIAGEIGNNSYDHNLGNWPDVPGSFFGYNLKEKKVILADRGQGVLKTLQRIKPDLLDYIKALIIAFTEYISHRYPEARGNGLKYVKEVIFDYGFKLSFQSGDAILNLDGRHKTLKTKKGREFIQGTFAIINY